HPVIVRLSPAIRRVFMECRQQELFRRRSVAAIAMERSTRHCPARIPVRRFTGRILPAPVPAAMPVWD
ncbi:MAG: hypothetical protein QF619_06050, partial [Candidatus Binatia bacterium]|nr:hypothetical protein [Candidatus Binatia bacterium]